MMRSRHLLPRLPLLCRQGNAAVEFALVAPIFFILVMAISDFGLYMAAQIRLANAVSAGALYAQTYYSLHYPSMNQSKNGVSYSTYVQTTGQAIYAAWASANIGVTGNAPTTGISPSITVVYNNAMQATNASDATFPTSAIGTHDATDNTICYCPNSGGTAPDFSAPAPCSQVCTTTANVYPGKYTTISASYVYTPMFPNFVLGQTRTISEKAVVRVQ